ncbi:MAG: hypothetical protein OXF05_00210 [Hyphomicrobiales bacterium]|nr:hypothetical protein [Hyphomicrobiales bacterium]MCY4033927.1 hypothetical protein [Hyphomicrobiales bacterium]MCY4039534.1 hypothetical protein [Hyphomicrobiales bacterium]
METTLTKTLMTTFAFALMVFAFNANSAFGWENAPEGQFTEGQFDELRDQDEDDATKTAWGGWQAVLDACKDKNGNWNRVKCPFAYFEKGDVERLIAGADDEKADQYKGQWFNETGDESEVAMARCTTDWKTGKSVCCVPASAGGVFCYYPSVEGKESQVAGLTRRQKQQQDEDDWNAWILQQFAGYMDSCVKSGNCMMLDEGNESEIAYDRGAELKALCRELNLDPCVEIWWNEDSESRDGFGGRDVADSGNENPDTSAASVDGQ